MRRLTFLTFFLALLNLPSIFALVLKATIHNPNTYDLIDYQVRIDLSKYLSQPTNLIVCTDIYNCVSTKLNFCYEQSNGECNTNPSKIIWVKVNLTANSNTTIWIKTSDVNYAVSGDQVFDFYDDFNDLTQWSTSGTVSVSNGVVYIGSSAGENAGIYRSVNYDNVVIEVKTKTLSTSAYHNSIIGFTKNLGGTCIASFVIRDGSNTIAIEECPRGNSIVHASTSVAISTGVWYIAKVIRVGNYVKGVLLDINGNILASVEITDTSSFAQAGVTFLDLGTHNAYAAYDWIRVRKYADQEPTIYLEEIKSEQITIQIINISIPYGIFPNYTNATISFKCIDTDAQQCYCYVNGDEYVVPNNTIYNITVPVFRKKVIYPIICEGLTISKETNITIEVPYFAHIILSKALYSYDLYVFFKDALKQYINLSYKNSIAIFPEKPIKYDLFYAGIKLSKVSLRAEENITFQVVDPFTLYPKKFRFIYKDGRPANDIIVHVLLFANETYGEFQSDVPDFQGVALLYVPENLPIFLVIEKNGNLVQKFGPFYPLSYEYTVVIEENIPVLVRDLFEIVWNITDDRVRVIVFSRDYKEHTFCLVRKFFMNERILEKKCASGTSAALFVQRDDQIEKYELLADSKLVDYKILFPKDYGNIRATIIPPLFGIVLIASLALAPLAIIQSLIVAPIFVALGITFANLIGFIELPMNMLIYLWVVAILITVLLAKK